ncbi:MAG TPA: hypothetical protein V6D33_12490 [Cyanophyceae cyanobacterium]
MATKPKASPTENGKTTKDLSGLYRKTQQVISVPLKVPDAGIDTELQMKLPTEREKKLLHELIIQTTQKHLGLTDADPGEMLIKGEQLLIRLASYLKIYAKQQEAEELQSQFQNVEEELRSKLNKVLLDIQIAIDAERTELDVFCFHLVNHRAIVEDAIAYCFPELSDPHELREDVAYSLILAMLMWAGKIPMV